MPIEQQSMADVLIDRYDYADRTSFAIDFGPAAEPTLDIVDGTAIIVGRDGHQREIDLPAGEVEAFNQNGVLTIEVSQ